MRTFSRFARGAALVAVFAGSAACEDKTASPTTSSTAATAAALTTATASATPSPTASAVNVLPPGMAKPAAVPAPEDVAEPPADAEKSKSGLAWKVLKEGTGEATPTDKDGVVTHYTGWMKNGTMFDSSVTRGEPLQFAVTGVIKGWTEGLQLMKVGEKRRFWIPADLAYGDRAMRPGAPTGQLTFDVELLEIVPPPPAPDDVAKPPADATKLASGLVYKVLEKGTGTTKPTENSLVSVNYTGWTKDGEVFDTTITGGKPAPLPLNRVIKGWQEGMQLMVEGEKARFWIPGDLAYGDKPQKPGAPAGQLTFDIELVRVMR